MRQISLQSGLPAGRLLEGLVAVVLAVAATGCQTGPNRWVQLAPYTDSTGHYPRPGCVDDLFFLFKGDEELRISWLNTLLLKMSVQEARNKVHPLRDPFDTKDASFKVQVQCLVPPKGSAEFTVTESEPGTVQLPGVGTITVTIDDTQYGRARLDRLEIQFEPDFYAKLPKTYYRQGKEWCLKAYIPEGKPQWVPTGRRQDYRYVTQLHLKDETGQDKPFVDIEVTCRPIVQEKRESKEWREYWPVDPRGFGAFPLRMRPLKPAEEDQKPKVVLGRSQPVRKHQPATGETIVVTFSLPDGTAISTVRPMTMCTDDKGRARLELWPVCRRLANVAASKIKVHFKCTGDHAKGGQTLLIDRVAMVPCARRHRLPPPAPAGPKR